MSQSNSQLKPNVATSLAQWHAMVASGNFSQFMGIIHPEAVFHSPMAFTPYRTAPALMMAISTVSQVFEDFTYHRELVAEDGLNVVLEFSARVGDKKLKGIDLIRFDEDGKIVEFEVMVRPFSGLQALGAEMGARLGQQMPVFKSKD